MSGVRNSCEASALNRRVCWNADSKRATIRFRTRVSRPISSSLSTSSTLCPKPSTVIFSAVAMIARTGRTTRFANHQAPSAIRIRATGKARK